MSTPVVGTSRGTVKRLPRIWPWILVMVLGVVLVPTGVAVYLAKTVGEFSQSIVRTPAHVSMQLGVGTYYVYEDTSSIFVPVLQPDNVSVASSNGRANAPYNPTSTETVTSNGTSYQGVVAFDVVREGDFSIRVRSPQGVRVNVFIQPSIVTIVTRNLGWIGLSAGGGLLFLVGLILLIVRGVQRSRRRAPPPTFEPRCANGHPANPQDRFCHTCGAPVYAAPPMMAPR